MRGVFVIGEGAEEKVIIFTAMTRLCLRAKEVFSVSVCPQ